jgi:hypothetical protein
MSDGNISVYLAQTAQYGISEDLVIAVKCAQNVFQ